MGWHPSVDASLGIALRAPSTIDHVLVFEAGNPDKIATGISPSSQDVEGQKLFCAPALLPSFCSLTHVGNQWFDIFFGLPFLL